MNGSRVLLTNDKQEKEKGPFSKLNEDASNPHSPRRQRPNSNNSVEVELNFSFWQVLFVVFVALFFARMCYRAPRYEIPIGKLMELVDLCSTEEGLSPSSLGDADSSKDEKEWNENSSQIDANPSFLHFIDIEEGEGKKRKKVRYSNLSHLSVSEYEIVGMAEREILEDASGKVRQKAKNVSFFSGRQGLDVDAEYFFETFEKAGFSDVRAKGEPGFLEKHGASLFSFLVILGLLFFLLKRLGANSILFRSGKDSLIAHENVHVSFQDVAGVDEAVEELKEVVDFLRNPGKYQALGGRIPKGVLLIGPPGTGKTLLAQAVAGEANVPFFCLSGSDFVELYVGVGAARVRDLFERAKKLSPAIIFIDELDALGKSRSDSFTSGGHEEREQTLNALLVEMDGFTPNSGIIVLAATNRPETLDSALLRSGRFDRQVLVDRPDLQGREEILNIHSKNVALSSDLNLKEIASLTSGFVGADLATLVNEAALLAARTDKTCVGKDEFNEAIERITTGLEKKRRALRQEEKERVAYHECGHALVAYLTPHADQVHKISIVPRGFAALGYTLQRPDEDRRLATKSELQAQLLTLLAGSIAEELFLKEASTGSQNDLERATEIARKMVVLFGMSQLGRVAFQTERDSFLDKGFLTREYSETTAREIDLEVSSIIENSCEIVKKLLMEHEETMFKLVARLLEVETLDGKEMKEIVEGEIVVQE